jgi:hypothetical protein
MIDTTASQLQKIFDLAFEVGSDIAVVKLQDLPEASTQALKSARQAAGRIYTLLTHEFRPGVNGQPVEMERP